MIGFTNSQLIYPDEIVKLYEMIKQWLIIQIKAR